ncbi:Ring-15 protein [Colletotrichum higginsianum IMI 349063]|uniref:Ring-15 protein n=2 Tax=Colletotrichum higginsianum (strain IMI 349063) TaxID=759273 RepID=A0A1B7Y6W6_COLHI|nr:Ring-15 protein [Colletotrichum higginsianum IMI 349063]OBR07747.1 Ring-15 protein [Colletotrichum higginsianum IMI 349063]
MSSTPSNLGKSLSASTSHSPSVQPGPVTTSFESNRRPSQASPSFPHATPRKNQGSRKQHKMQRRPGLGDIRQHSNPDDDDAMAEARALRNASSRRGQTSITHLLNYSLPPRAYADHSSYARNYRRNPTWGPGSGHHAVDKARYVHANYRFVVSPEGNYASQAADADVHIDWNNVLQILASSESQGASCPICLSEPVAPRMAKCGHIFCLPCLIRFMNSTDDDSKPGKGARWKKCPLCEDSVYLHETRPVRFYAGQESPLPRVGDDVVLRLMARTAKSTLALPWENGSDALNVADDVPWHFAANVLDYARIMKGTGDYMAEQYNEEIEALQKQGTEDQLLYHEDDEWTQKAIRAINAAKEKVQDLGKTDSMLPNKKPGQSKTVQPDFYFYSSQPHLYLSALDIRILKTKYGDFSAFPTTLLPRVEHISTGHVLDEVQRKRAKYLGHLPYGCRISFLECDWTDIVPADVLDKFADEIGRRRKRNRDKAVQEERERLQSERIEAAQFKSTAAMRREYGPIEEEQVPALNLEEFQPLASHAGATPPDPRPGFEHLASISTSPSTQKTVWGTHVVHGSPELAPASLRQVDDGWLKEEDFIDAAELSFQMEALGVMEPGPSSSSTPVAAGAGGGGGGIGGGGKGKKKKQKITLMSTGGRRQG